MKKKILSSSVKLIKLSVWVASILTLIIVLLVAFLMIFPTLIKAPIESQFSKLSGLDVEISNPYLDFNNGSISLQIDKLEAGAIGQKNLVVVANDLQWDVHLRSLLGDTYRPNTVFISTLTLYPNVVPIKQLITLLSTKNPGYLELLSINKTIIKGEKRFEIAPMLLTRDVLKITGQNFTFDLADTRSTKVNIDVTLPSYLTANTPLTAPILISNEQLSMNAEIKFFNKQGDDWLEFNSSLKNMQANNLTKYLPLQLLGNETYAWIKRGFIAGSLQDTKLHIKKNLSKPSAVDMQFSTELKDTELLFDSDWKPLKKLNASLRSDGKKVVTMVHNTKLNDISLKNIKVQIADLTQNNLDVEVISKINTQSEQLVEFLKRAPLDKKINETLRQFSLSGKVEGDMKLVIPLDERESILDIDLMLKDNRLSILENKVAIKNYTSKLGFHNNEITAIGVGDIRGSAFDIHINPSNRDNDNKNIFAVELINHNSGFKAYIAKQFDQSWHAKVKSKSLEGNMAIFLNENKPLNVRLSNVYITALDALKGNWKIIPKDLPNMHLSTQDIYVNGDVLPNFGVDLTVEDNVAHFDNLKFSGIEIGNKALSFHGFWEDGKTQLEAKAKGKNLDKFLQQLKIKEKVVGGNFDFDVHLACECTPWNMNYQDITGYLKMNVKKGVFTDKDPNFWRVLSLLNINSIAKRLKLDVSDVTDKGFTYENIEAKILLQDAIAKIEHFKLNALSGNIVLTGQGDLLKQQYDLVAKVTPAISGAVPAATYLAGGGLIGLGVWAVDKKLFDGKIINSIVDEVMDFKYKITGSWDKPVIKSL